MVERVQVEVSGGMVEVLGTNGGGRHVSGRENGSGAWVPAAVSFRP